MKEKLVFGISEFFKGAGKKTAVLGLSGGVDSAVVCALLAGALGKENVFAYYLPYKKLEMDDSVDRIHAREVAQKFGVNFEEKSIFSALHSISNLCSSADRLELGNTCSRLRMICLYNFAKQKDAIVVGTGNKSELMTGYFTKFGDGGCDVLPIGCLLKRDVLQLAGNLGVPNAVIEKAPSAGLWEGQTDEGEMGLTYKKLDEILEVFPNFSDEDDVEFKKIKFLFNRSAHKREMPKVLNVLE